MNLVQRVQDILLRPKATWPQIDEESTDVKSLYTQYICILGAIPAIASFIGLSLIGVGAFGVDIRVPILSGLTRLVVGYIVSLALVFVLSLVVDALAPTFGGRKSPISALKLVAYGGTAGFVGGIFALLPSLSILGFLAALYSIYLIYVGLPVVMKCPADKAGVYTAAVVGCAIVIGLVFGALSAVIAPTSIRSAVAIERGTGDGTVTLNGPGGKISIDTAQLNSMSQKVQDASTRAQAAQATGDTAGAAKAVGDIMGAIGAAGAAGGALIPAHDLKAFVPGALLGMTRKSFEASSGQALGMGASTAHGTFADGDKHMDLTITDVGGIGAFAAVAGFAQVMGESEDDKMSTKTYKQGTRTVHEESAKDGSRSELTMFLSNGVLVEAAGQHLDLAQLRSALDAVNVDKIEALKRPGKG